VPRFTKIEFPGLYKEFIDSGYLASLDGIRHLDAYEEGRNQSRLNFESVVEARERGEDVTDLVLLKLLPHNETKGNRNRGAWVHIAPAIQGDIKKWFEGARWTSSEDWPAISDAILNFFQWCNEGPELLSEACTEFAQLPYVKGFQTGMLTPMLNALRPEDYLLVNYKSRQTINYFSGESYGLKLTDYPAINLTGLRLIEEFAREMDQPGAPELSDADRFDMFSHWLVAERKYPFPDKRYWKIAPGEKGWQWEECKENGFIGIGWNDLGDVSGLSRAEFDALQEKVEAERGKKKEATNQVWTFAHDIQEGDVIVANRGTREILGIGTVVGPHEFVPDARYTHQFPVRWDDTVPRRIDEKGWRRTLIEIKPEKYKELRTAPPLDGEPRGDVEEAHSDAEFLFSAETFDLLTGLHEDPTKTYYQEHREAIRDHVEQPFRRLVREVAQRLPAPITGLMETEKGVFARILKNDWGRGGAWDFYWGAFYPKGGRRIEDAQLMTVLKKDYLEFGFYVGHYGSDQRERFLTNCRKDRVDLFALLVPTMGEGFVYGEDKGGTPRSRGHSLSQWLEDMDEMGNRASTVITRERVLELSSQDLIDTATRTFELLFPFVLLATSEDPMSEIIEYLGVETGVSEPGPEYTIEQLSRDTGIGEEKLRRWVRAIDRKGQAIFYGPPGTGKTFIAQHLAKHLTGGTGSTTWSSSTPPTPTRISCRASARRARTGGSPTLWSPDASRSFAGRRRSGRTFAC
jgi:5-methylcytosine-specific restriction enzyme B